MYKKQPSRPADRQPASARYTQRRPRMASESLKQDVGFLIEHRMPLDSLCNFMGTDLKNGLSEQQCKEKMRAYGPNEIKTRSGVPEPIKFAKHLFGGFQLFIWIGAILAIICFTIQKNTHDYIMYENLYLSIVLFVLVMFSAILGYMLERTSGTVSYAFQRLSPQQATVTREGKKLRVTSTEVVPGDLVEVAMGEMVPADIRIISSQSFRVDNSALTGDSEPQLRVPELADEHSNAIFATNMAFYSTVAVDGYCTGLVVYTGDNTVIGRIANLAASVDKDDSPLAEESDTFMIVLTCIGLALGFVIWLICFVHWYYYWIEAIMFFIGTSLACAPLGFVVIYTMCMFAVAQRLNAKGFHIRNTSALAMLGSIDTILADKTGTLTENRLTVNKIWMDGVFFEMAESSYYSKSPTWQQMMLCLLLTSRAQRQKLIGSHDSEQSEAEADPQHPLIRHRLLGDPIDVALMEFIEPSLPNYGRYADLEHFRDANPVTAEIPFNAKNKFHLAYLPLTEPGMEGHWFMMKGAPEVVVQRCAAIMTNGRIEPLTASMRAQVEHAFNSMCSEGERVLAFCDRASTAVPIEQLTTMQPSNDMVLLGLISFRDPPLPGMLEAVRSCQQAGIKVLMITGDHPITAEAVAKQVGIITGKTLKDVAIERGIPLEDVHPSDPAITACVVNGVKLQYPSEISTFLHRYKQLVFARITPEQKMDIVIACQRRGEVVAVTGDGINDAAALRKANVGFAMGAHCADVCKESADIFVSDTFSSLVSVIEEGKLVYNNLKKALRLIMTSNMAETIPFVLFIILDLPLPFGTIAVILVDLITNLFPALALAYEETEKAAALPEDQDPMVFYKAPGQADSGAVQYSMYAPGMEPEKTASQKMQEQLNHEPSVRQRGLINHSLLNLAYGQLGAIETSGCIFVYFIAMAHYGFWPIRLIGCRHEWDSRGINDLEDSYGQQWTYWQRKELEYTAQAGFFGGLVLFQLLNAFLAKMRWTSLPMIDRRNHMLWGAMGLSFAFGALFIYVPGLNWVLYLKGIYVQYFVIYVIWMVIMFVLDEVRRFLIRRHARNPKAGFFSRTAYTDWFY